MQQQITVYDENEVKVGTTFSRRAKQLVSKRRADWVDESCTAIHLLQESREELKLDKEFSSQTNGGYEIADDHEDLYDKECLLCLAKKRVREKKSLMRHIGIYILACAFLSYYLHNTIYYYYGGYEQGVVSGVLWTWSAFLLRDIAVYVYSRLKGTNLLKRYNQDPVEAEYKKLKKMEPNRIVMEYKRL